MPLVQHAAKPLVNHIPAVAGVTIALEIHESFVEDFAMPFEDRTCGSILGGRSIVMFSCELTTATSHLLLIEHPRTRIIT